MKEKILEEQVERLSSLIHQQNSTIEELKKDLQDVKVKLHALNDRLKKVEWSPL